jgi:hypothetical protein
MESLVLMRCAADTGIICPDEFLHFRDQFIFGQMEPGSDEFLEPFFDGFEIL